MMLVRRVFDTPVGPMMALATDAALCALEFGKPGRMTRLDARLRRWFPPCAVADGDNHVIAQTSDWLDKYFCGHAAVDPPLDMRGASFELRVWAALREIPYGETTSYGELAEHIGSPGAARAVGLANGRNPISIVVPCHRVIGADGSLVGYGGGLERKRALLALEAEVAAGFRATLW